MRWRLACLVAVLGIAAGVDGASAEARRVALLIGNGAYQQLAQLANPAADAAALGARLDGLGFETLIRTDLSMRGMVDAFKAFRSAAEGADFALLYFAGHGRRAAVEGCAEQNYLFPVDASPDAAIDLAREAMTIDEIFATYLAPAGAGSSLVLVDAGRPLDLWGEAAAAGQGAAAERGFAAEMPHSEAWLNYEIWYASEPGTAADDGPPGTSSPFAAALLAALEEPGLDTDALFRRVAALMREAPDTAQRPAPFGRLGAPVVINDASPAADASPPAPPVTEGIPDLSAIVPSAGSPGAGPAGDAEPAPTSAADAPAIPGPLVATAAPDAGAALADDPALPASPDMIEPAAAAPTAAQLAALLAWSEQQSGAGQYEGAITALEQVLQYDPDNLEAWMALSDALLARGDYHQAMEAFRPRASLDLGPGALVEIGDTLAESGHPQQATMNFLMALTMAEASGDTETAGLARARIESIAAALASQNAEQRLRERLEAAWGAVEAGRYADAQAAHDGILGDWPGMADDPELNLLAAEIADRQGRADEAEALYRRVAESDAGGAFGVRAEQALGALGEAREREEAAASVRAALARADQIPVSALQWAMKALSHYAGPIDDNFGPTSRTAAQAFQERIGAEPTGALTDEQKVLLVTMAAESGQAESQNTLGIMYATGVGVPADPDQARLWWERAAAQGFSKAEDNLARLDQ